MKANGAEGRRFPGVITSGYPANNAFSAKMVLGRMTLQAKSLSVDDEQITFAVRMAACGQRPLSRPVRVIGGKL
jgi:hypothetical protein